MRTLLSLLCCICLLLTSCREESSQSLDTNASSQATPNVQPLYIVDGDQVFFAGYPIAGADHASLMELAPGSAYGRDKINVYLDGLLIAGADPVSFTVIDEENFYAKDARQVFLGGYAIQGADPSTFALIKPPFARDANHVYLGYAPLPYATPDSLRFLDTDFAEATDGVHHYRPFIPYWERGFEQDPSTYQELGDGYAGDMTQVWHEGRALTLADRETFLVLQDGYAKDAKHVFFQGQALAGRDADSFTVLGDGYTKDNKAVWLRSAWKETKVDGVDPASFVLLSDPSGKIVHSGAAKDKDHVYCDVFQIDEADPATFILLSGASETNRTTCYCFAKDKERVYWELNEIQGADPDTFSPLPDPPGSYRLSGYSKDKDRVYWGLLPLPKADPATFMVLYVPQDIEDEYYHVPIAKDKEHIFIGRLWLPLPTLATLLTPLEQEQADSGQDALAQTELILQEENEPNTPSGNVSRRWRDISMSWDVGKFQFPQGADSATYNFMGFRRSNCVECEVDAFYGKDAGQVFCSGKILNGADPQTFSLYPCPADYTHDATTVYYKGEPVSGVDSDSFLPFFSCLGYGQKAVTGGVDRHGLWLGSTFAGPFKGPLKVLLSGESLTSWQVEGSLPWLLGNGQAAYILEGGTMARVVDVDDATFQPLTPGMRHPDQVGARYARDKNKVYCKGRIVDGADPVDFMALPLVEENLSHLIDTGEEMGDRKSLARMFEGLDGGPALGMDQRYIYVDGEQRARLQGPARLVWPATAAPSSVTVLLDKEQAWFAVNSSGETFVSALKVDVPSFRVLRALSATEVLSMDTNGLYLNTTPLPGVAAQELRFAPYGVYARADLPFELYDVRNFSIDEEIEFESLQEKSIALYQKYFPFDYSFFKWADLPESVYLRCVAQARKKSCLFTDNGMICSGYAGQLVARNTHTGECVAVGLGGFSVIRGVDGGIWRVLEVADKRFRLRLGDLETGDLVWEEGGRPGDSPWVLEGAADKCLQN